MQFTRYILYNLHNHISYNQYGLFLLFAFLTLMHAFTLLFLISMKSAPSKACRTFEVLHKHWQVVTKAFTYRGNDAKFDLYNGPETHFRVAHNSSVALLAPYCTKAPVRAPKRG